MSAAQRKRYDEELARHRTFLRRLIAARDFTLEELDRKFGYGRSYLSRLLSGETALTVVHVLAILEAIDYPADKYFSALYPPSSPVPAERPGDWKGEFLHALRRVEDLLSQGTEGSSPGPELRSPDERIEQSVDEALRNVRSRPARKGS